MLEIVWVGGTLIEVIWMRGIIEHGFVERNN